MSESLSLLVLTISILLILPIALWKSFHDYKFPLISHEFSFPIELRRFYFPYLGVFFGLCSIYFFLGFVPNWSFFDRAIFPAGESGVKTGIQEVLNYPTLIFLVLLYLLSGLGGTFFGTLHRQKITKAMAESKDFFAIQDVKLVGLWGALLNRGRKLTVNLDILISGNLLYSGTLFYYEADKSKINVLALKNTRRYLIPLSEVRGTEERKFDIPGDVTYFPGSTIKNINIRNIILEEDDRVIYGKNIDAKSIEELEKIFEKLLASTNPTDRANQDDNNVKKDNLATTE
jgi:hypothetical protein